MTAAERIVDLIVRWQDLRAQGQPATPNEVCAECPELLPEFQRRLDEVASLQAMLRTATFDDRSTEPHSAPANGAAEPALSLPGYEILGVLGRGGMGIVYHARQLQLKRPVALKMIRSGHQAGDAEVARFRVEAEAIARLQHPNIVQIYEVGMHQGQPYCSLEFVGGGTLAARLSGAPQPPRQAAQIGRTLALAIAAAHDRGIVHRDLKPSNVLLAEDGAPKITDFGLAKRLDVDDGQTRTGVVMGTPAYMAPEQATGQKEVGPAADVYALGAILYEMLTGRPPFKGTTVLDTLEQVRMREPVPVRLLQPKVPRDLETICLKCLQKEPRKRYVSAAALAQDLDCWLAGKPIQARPSRAWERGYRWVRRNPVVATLGALLLLAFSGGFAGIAWQLSNTEAALQTVNTNLYFQRVSLAYREAQAGNNDRAEMLLDLCPVSLRHWEWHYLKRRCHADWRRLQGHTDLVRCVAFHPDGTRLASCSNDGTIKIWDIATARELLTFTGHVSWVSAVVFHADGRRLVSAGENGNVRVWDLASGRTLASFQHSFNVALSPRGDFFSVLDNEKLTIFEVETGRPLTVIRGRIQCHNRTIAFSPDGGRVAAPLDACLRIWDVRTAQQIHVLQYSMERGVYSMTFSADGRYLFAAYPEDKYPALKGWDAITGKELPQRVSSPVTAYAIALSADGQQIATGGHEGVVKVRDTTTGRNLHARQTFGDSVVSLAFQPNGQALAVATGRHIWLRGWRSHPDKETTVLEGHKDGPVALSFDGSRVATCADDDHVRLWNAQSGERLLKLTKEPSRYSGVAFSPDGGCLLAISRDGAILTWDTTTGQAGASLRPPGSVFDACFDHGSQRVASAGADRMVRIWDRATGRELLSCEGHEAGVLCVQFAPDGRQLASAGGDGAVRLWDAATGKALLVLRGHEGYVQSIAFDPQGRLLASASTDETVRLWDLAAGREVAMLEGHTGPVRGLSFSADGRRLASSSEDGTARLWDVATGQEALTLPEHGAARRIVFTPDGRHLVTASADGTVQHWNATPLQP
jgi:WD40 repeat protein